MKMKMKDEVLLYLNERREQLVERIQGYKEHRRFLSDEEKEKAINYEEIRLIELKSIIANLEVS